MNRILPNVHDLDQRGFWEAARREELVVRTCVPNGHVIHLPRSYCARCDSFDVTWSVVDGAATVHSWTIVEHAVDSAFPVPYTVALVELLDPASVRFVTHLDGRADLRAGQPMRLWFEHVSDDVVLPRWAPA
jgi:uncharacterized OB-fold protein